MNYQKHVSQICFCCIQKYLQSSRGSSRLILLVWIRCKKGKKSLKRLNILVCMARTGGIKIKFSNCMNERMQALWFWEDGYKKQVKFQ